jgi:hypothetical protein
VIARLKIAYYRMVFDLKQVFSDLIHSITQWLNHPMTQSLPVMLRFPAWHFHLSGGPIPEDNGYAYALAGVCFPWDAGLGTSRPERASATGSR